jgi:hypothetical protein
VVTPGATPVTTPLPGVTVAIPVKVLVHMPPVVTSESGIVMPTHTEVGPVIGAGAGSTAMVVVA